MQHYIKKSDGGELNLTQEGEVAGFRANDRVRYSEECSPEIRGKTATVVGFDAERQIWTQPDGQTGCHSTRPDFAIRHLIKIA